MRPENLHDLLVGAVPPLPTPPDRMAQVRRRVVRARGLRVSASVLATVAVIGGAALGARALAPAGLPGANTAGPAPTAPAPASSTRPTAQASPTGSSPSAKPANVLGEGECPRSLDLMSLSIPDLSSTIQAPLRNVTVCRYRHEAFDLSKGSADLLAGPKQGTSDAFAPAIQAILYDFSHPSARPNSGCSLPQPSQNVSVDVVYAVDAQGKAHDYLLMRITCAGGGEASSESEKKLEAAVDQLLGPPY